MKVTKAHGRAGTLSKKALRDWISKLLYASGLTRLDRLGRAHLGIITFHRVLPEALRDTYPMPGLAVTPEELDWFIRLFQSHFELMPLSEAIARFEDAAVLRGERPPPLAITFDDGQRDNFEYARPVLNNAGVRASFYVTTDAIEKDRTLWHDEVGYGLRRSREVDTAARSQLLCELGVDDALDDVQTAEGACRRAKALSGDERGAWLCRLRDVVQDVGRPDWDGMMTWVELSELASEGHEIGAHSATHAILPHCSDEDLQREVKACRDAIRQRLNVPCETFCYPNGDHDERTVSKVREADYRAAVTTRWGFNRSKADPYRLCRFDIQARNMRNRHGMLSKELLAWRMSGLHPGHW